MKKVTLYLALIILTCAGIPQGQELKTRILQTKLDRIYFDCGLESFPSVSGFLLEPREGAFAGAFDGIGAGFAGLLLAVQPFLKLMQPTRCAGR
jgi:hypothetical protein